MPISGTQCADRKTRYLPFREAILQTTRLITALPQRRDGLERQDAPRATAVRYDLSIRR
jgi:hypothetical protein